MSHIIVGVICLIGGFVAGYFVMRNNPKYFDIDDILKGERDKLIGLGREKLEELKKRVEDALKDLKEKI
jgi:hypothetical protein